MIDCMDKDTNTFVLVDLFNVNFINGKVYTSFAFVTYNYRLLISLTLIRLRGQNFLSPSNWFCIPVSESESNT